MTPRLPNRILQVSTEEAYEMVLRLAREEGLFVGISSGAAAAAALRDGSRTGRRRGGDSLPGCRL